MDIETEEKREDATLTLNTPAAAAGVEISELHSDFEEDHEQEKEQGQDQDGSSRAVPPAPSSETAEETPTVGYEAVPCRQQTSHGHDHSETDRESPSRSPVIMVQELEDEDDDDDDDDDDDKYKYNCDYDEDDDVFSPPDQPKPQPEVWKRRIKPTDKFQRMPPSKRNPLSTVQEEFNDEDEIQNDDICEKENFDSKNDNDNDAYVDAEYTETGNNGNAERSRKEKGSTKVVIRRLPPKMLKKDFIDAVSPLPEYDYLAIDNPDPEWDVNARSVAHINFLEEEDALWFIERFNRYKIINEDGEEYIALCDFAMIPRIFRPLQNKTIENCNPKRGSLNQSESYQEFLKKYDENPFAFTMGVVPNNGEVLTTEMMLEEIENRPKTTGPITTPLLEAIMNKKARREAERQARREKDRELREKNREARDKLRRERDRDRDKRDQLDKEPTGEASYRELKRERRRERRERERKERRERERLEKEAIRAKAAKGVIVTYSKSGKVTRWSANSSPFTKSEDVNDIEMSESKQDENAAPVTNNQNKESTSEKSIPNTNKPEEKDPQKIKPQPRNPFSKDVKPPSKSEGDRSRFGKPFPGMKSRERDSNSNNSKRSSVEKEKVAKSVAPFSSATTMTATTSSSSATSNLTTSSAGASANNTISEPAKESGSVVRKPSEDKQGKQGNGDGDNGEGIKKKKIVKKIIRVRKVKKGEGTDGQDTGAKGVAVSTTTKKPSLSSSSSKDKNASMEKPASSSVVDVEKGVGDKATFTITTDKKEQEPNSSGAVGAGDVKRRRARPDMQIYRPGSLRKDTSNKPPPKNKTCDDKA